ncbi:hypothetical protein [Hyunsoonleella pacifica]|uniref:Uncharacterized protein n=1 Tax=Hyunsoonleella pacifica TaxID=1080224 RepID=A0A4Q9FT01_9FLAO|nr:hypothetical protein [Hyunsoonleella pacifica]TBN18830.1 hypothetical protein EYD46_01840 [Hyunsoonleella pacifica]GGD05140.1 hypothetical protein GCM10011368_03680 [Hyunsoonleella pacifica]
MKIIESDFSNQIVKFVQNKLGDIFFFNHIAVVELNEGIHFDINNAPLILEELKSYFGETKPFGVIANRVNSYSVELLDTPKYREEVKNLKSYGVVGHDAASKMNATIENDFCLSEKVDYDTIYDAINHVYNKVKNSKLFSLN